jgi:hypothetical protein
MSMTPFTRDEIADPRHEAPTKRGLEGFLSTNDRPSTHPPPATRTMSADERLDALAPDTSRSGDIDGGWDDEPAAPILPPAPVWADKEPEEVDGTTDATRRFERKTLPSARLTPPPVHAQMEDLSWDGATVVERKTSVCPPPAEALLDKPRESDDFTGQEQDQEPLEEPEETPASSPSLWGSVQRFVARFGRKRSLTPPPESPGLQAKVDRHAPVTSVPPPRSLTPLVSRQKPALKVLLDLLWMLDEGELDTVMAHVERVSALRRLGSDAYAEARILDALAAAESEDRTMVLPTLRARVPEIARATVDDALLRLESRGCLALGPTGPGDDVAERDVIRDPARGPLGRCALKVSVR